LRRSLRIEIPLAVARREYAFNLVEIDALGLISGSFVQRPSDAHKSMQCDFEIKPSGNPPSHSTANHVICHYCISPSCVFLPTAQYFDSQV